MKSNELKDDEYRKKYLSLFKKFPLRPIKTDEENENAINMVHSMVDHANGEDDMHAAEKDFLEVLAILINDYEEKRYPDKDVSAIDMLKHLLEAHEINQSELAKGSGIHASTISEIMHGRRKLNLTHIKKLSEFFNVDAALFLPNGK